MTLAKEFFTGMAQIVDQLNSVKSVLESCGFTDPESRADPAKAIQALAATLGQREGELLTVKADRDTLREVQRCYINNDTRSGEEWNLAERVVTAEADLQACRDRLARVQALCNEQPTDTLLLLKDLRAVVADRGDQ